MSDTEPEAAAETLREALAKYDIDLASGQIEKLESYCQLLWQWNEKLNLTRHTDYDTFACRDVLDCVQLSGLLRPDEEVLDVGTGGGVPGIVLAILRPDLQISLSESVGKKSQAIDEMTRALNLPTPVHRDRAEKVLEDMRFDVLVARAVGPLWKICKWFENHWHEFDRLLAIKGPNWPAERGEARHRGLMHSIELRCAASYPMPGTESESVILKLSAKGRQDAAGTSG